MEVPFVTGIMATFPGREHLLEAALRYWGRQTYPRHRRELILVSEDPPDKRVIRPIGTGGAQLNVEPGTLLGIKLNRAVELGRGDFFLKLDDDDWYSETYLERAIHKVLLQRDPERAILTPAVFPIYFVESGDVLRWKGDWSGLGTGMLFSKTLWRLKPFNEKIPRGLDSDFVQRTNFDPVAAPDDSMCYVRHGVGHLFREVGPETADGYFRRVFSPHDKTLDELMPPEDAAFYRKMTSKARGDTLREWERER